MKYAIIAAVAGIAAAAPADWEPYTTTTTSSYGWEAYTTTTTSTYGWEPVKPTTTSSYGWEAYTTTTTKAAEWSLYPTTTKCSTVSKYTTTVCGDKKDAWDNCKPTEYYITLYPTKCPATTTTWAEWVPIPTTTKCSTVSKYTTTVCGDKKDAWDNCKPTEYYTTMYPTVCPTTYSETWAPVSYTTMKTPAASTSSWSPVATFKGAADKQAVGFGALAIAAVAAML